MPDRQSSLALREWRKQFSAPRVWIVLMGIVCILTLVGPFETLQRLRIGPRFAYWAVLAVATYSAGIVIGNLVGPIIPRRAASWVRAIVIGAANGAGITAVIYIINSLAFGNWLDMAQAPAFLINVFAIAAIISGILEVVSTDHAPPTTPDTSAPAVLNRLAFDKRGELVTISVQDHYVLVTTTKGSELILMRLSDAIAETSPVSGLQVHRSHWVALAQITSAERQKERAILTMSNNSEIPVSRTYMSDIRAAGIL